MGVFLIKEYLCILLLIPGIVGLLVFWHSELKQAFYILWFTSWNVKT